VSNDKASATYHGRKRSFLVGDLVQVTELPEFDRVTGRIVQIQDSVYPYVVQIEQYDDAGAFAINRAFDWLALTPYDYKPPVWHLRTGEGAVVCGASGPGEMSASHLEDVTCGACYQIAAEETTGEHVFHKLDDPLYQDWADERQHVPTFTYRWTPTPRSLVFAGVVIVLILATIFGLPLIMHW
jgi:hypothetical protein